MLFRRGDEVDMHRLGIAKTHVLSRGAACYRDLVYLAAQDRKLLKRGLAHTLLIGVDQNELAGLENVRWKAVALCVVERPMIGLVVVGSNGAVRFFSGEIRVDEQVPSAQDLRAGRTIAGHAYVCGMNRQVFARFEEGRWTAMHAPAVDNDGDIAGFEAIDGFSANDLYAVGWEGEIWHCDAGRWSDCQSPVNVILSGVCCAPDEQVYACGQQGTLLRGRGDAWDVLRTPDLDDDLWDVHWFGGALYVASMSSLYTLAGDSLVPVKFDIDPPSSFYKLTDADGVLWSVGQEALLSFDGQRWERWD